MQTLVFLQTQVDFLWVAMAFIQICTDAPTPVSSTVSSYRVLLHPPHPIAVGWAIQPREAGKWRVCQTILPFSFSCCLTQDGCGGLDKWLTEDSGSAP